MVKALSCLYFSAVEKVARRHSPPARRLQFEDVHGALSALDDEPKEVFRHCEELESVGLAAPQVTYIMKKLRDNGYDVRDDVTTIEEAKTEIIRYFSNLKSAKTRG